jgi:ROS/MUCR transcriptional regulator protein
MESLARSIVSRKRRIAATVRDCGPEVAGGSRVEVHTELTTNVVAAYVRRNQIGADQLPILISTVHQALANHRFRGGRARRFVCRFSFAATFRLAGTNQRRLERLVVSRGTDGSNPVPSSEESRANLTFGGRSQKLRARGAALWLACFEGASLCNRDRRGREQQRRRAI